MTQVQMPLEIAIEVVEQLTRIQTHVRYEAYVDQANQIGLKRALGNLKHYVDHVLSLLIHHKYLIRVHHSPGYIEYTPSSSWAQRDSVLSLLRTPKPVNRAWRTRRAQAQRQAKQAARLESQRQDRERRERDRADRRAAEIAQRGLTANGKLRRIPKSQRVSASPHATVQ